MSESIVQDPPSNALDRAAKRKRQRLIGWFFLGLILSLFPLLVTALMEYLPGQTSLLEILSNEELLTVAFTLSGAATVDVLIDSRDGVGKFLLGVITLLATLATISAYILFKAHLTHLTHDTIVTSVQGLYVGTALLAFACEITSS